MAKKIKSVVVIIAVAVIAIFIIAKGNPFYIVDEGNQVVVTRFKGIVAIRTDAGLYFKIPFVDKITTYPKKILSMDGDLEEIKTKDDLRIVCDITARWKITDPKAFYKSFQKLDNGYVKLSDVIDSACRNVIPQNKLSEIVRSSNLINQISVPVAENTEENAVKSEGFNVANLKSANNTYEEVVSGRSKLCKEMVELANKNLTSYGIEIIDIVPRQIKYSDQLTESVYNRMIKDRNQLAEAYRSAGQGEKAEWLGKLENDKKTIESEAYRKAEEIKGNADAQAAKIYAEAYNKDPDFYIFWKSMESYKTTLKDYDATYSTKMDYFDYLYGVNGR